MSKLIKLTFSLLLASRVLADLNYCDHVKNCGYLRNIVCERDHDCDATGDCEEVTVNLATKKYIVETFNEHRNEVALGKHGLPKASNMLTQLWDDDLAYVTKCSQNTCEHRDENCINTVKFMHTFLLDNVLPVKKVKDDLDFFKKSLQKWIQPSHYKKMYVDYFNDTKRRPDAAIITSNSVGVGCALSRDSKNYHGSCSISGFPRDGEPVYLEGDPCKKCPSGLPCNIQYRGLCGKVILPVENNKSPVIVCGCLLWTAFIYIYIMR